MEEVTKESSWVAVYLVKQRSPPLNCGPGGDTIGKSQDIDCSVRAVFSSVPAEIEAHLRPSLLNRISAGGLVPKYSIIYDEKFAHAEEFSVYLVTFSAVGNEDKGLESAARNSTTVALVLVTTEKELFMSFHDELDFYAARLADKLVVGLEDLNDDLSMELRSLCDKATNYHIRAARLLDGSLSAFLYAILLDKTLEFAGGLSSDETEDVSRFAELCKGAPSTSSSTLHADTSTGRLTVERKPGDNRIHLSETAHSAWTDEWAEVLDRLLNDGGTTVASHSFRELLTAFRRCVTDDMLTLRRSLLAALNNHHKLHACAQFLRSNRNRDLLLRWVENQPWCADEMTRVAVILREHLDATDSKNALILLT